MFTIPRRKLATSAVLCSAALFGTTGTVLVNAPDGADAWSVGAIRLLIGGLTLAAVARWRGGDLRAPWRRAGEHTGTPWNTLLGALGVAVFQLGYFLAVERTGVAVGTVVTIGSGPVLSGIITAAMERRSPDRRWVVGTAVSIAGVAMLGLLGREVHTDPLGIALAVLAGLGWAVFATVSKRHIDAGIDSTASMAAVFGGGAVLLAPLLMWHSPSWFVTPSGLLVGLYLGVVTVGVAYTLYGFALRHLHTPTVITLTLLEPITAALLGAVVVHEGIRPAGWVGIALVVLGLGITVRTTTAEHEATATVVA
jgi:DME family drug/metabolite transporter